MRLRKAIIMRYRSVDYLDIEMGPLTILFGKNNVGKTNVLEAIYGILAPETMPGYPGSPRPARGVRGDERSRPVGAVYAALESGLLFDDDVLARRTRVDTGDSWWLTSEEEQLGIELFPLSPDQVSIVFDSVKSGLCFADPELYFGIAVKDSFKYEFFDLELSEKLHTQCCIGEPRPLPVFVDWGFADLSEKVTTEIQKWAEDDTWLRKVDADEGVSWRVDPLTDLYITILPHLATKLLPDFLQGSIRAELRVPTRWGEAPSVDIAWEERGTGRHARSVQDVGSGAARWIAASTQIAMHVIANHFDHDSDLPFDKWFSGGVLFVDEPEAHLHPDAVASILRWCQRMVDLEFNIVVASHHEAFLRASGDNVRFVKISHDAECTQARTLLSSTTSLLQDLAAEVGMHPATLLSLHRAILFVEGPLDEAVLDEFAGPQLDAAGVLIVPIHGTKNLEGLIDGELTTRLGIKTGVLTDNTVTTTMMQRSNKKRSSEEVKLVRLIRRFEDRGLPPPDLFGVPEDDLLFAIPPEAIRQCFADSDTPFPGWHELREECRQAVGKGPSDSVDWKAYAEEHYHLPLTSADGVRSVVHAVDLAGVQLPSIQAVIDDVIIWARSDLSTARPDGAPDDGPPC